MVRDLPRNRLADTGVLPHVTGASPATALGLLELLVVL
jgi:hypothetical protein